jgi:hypothetical protein
MRVGGKKFRGFNLRLLNAAELGEACRKDTL